MLYRCIIDDQEGLHTITESVAINPTNETKVISETSASCSIRAHQMNEQLIELDYTCVLWTWLSCTMVVKRPTSSKCRDSSALSMLVVLAALERCWPRRTNNVPPCSNFLPLLLSLLQTSGAHCARLLGNWKIKIKNTRAALPSPSWPFAFPSCSLLSAAAPNFHPPAAARSPGAKHTRVGRPARRLHGLPELRAPTPELPPPSSDLRAPTSELRGATRRYEALPIRPGKLIRSACAMFPQPILCP